MELVDHRALMPAAPDLTLDRGEPMATADGWPARTVPAPGRYDGQVRLLDGVGT